MIVNRCLLYVFIALCFTPSPYSCPGNCIRNFSYLKIIFCAIFVTAFAIFPICRLSLLYTCDCIRTFFHLQIIFPTIFVTAFAIFPIYRLSPLQTNDRIRNFSHLQIIFCATPPLRLCLGMLTSRIIPCMDNEYSRGLRHEMQASFRHQAHYLSDSEFGRLADNRRMQRVANAAVLQVHTRDKPTVTSHHIHSYNAYLRPFFSCFLIPPGGLFSPSILVTCSHHLNL